MGSADRNPRRWLVTGAVYGALVVLGAVEGLIGSFQYSHVAGPVPLAALVSCLVILATCLLAIRPHRLNSSTPSAAASRSELARTSSVWRMPSVSVNETRQERTSDESAGPPAS